MTIRHRLLKERRYATILTTATVISDGIRSNASFPEFERLLLFSYLPKYVAISFILSDCFTWKGQRLSQWPQSTQSDACFSSFP